MFWTGVGFFAWAFIILYAEGEHRLCFVTLNDHVPYYRSHWFKPHTVRPIPYSLVVRISGSHPVGPGSIPGVGTNFSFFHNIFWFAFQQRMIYRYVVIDFLFSDFSINSEFNHKLDDNSHASYKFALLRHPMMNTSVYPYEFHAFFAVDFRYQLFFHLRRSC